jgi:hypothetical protein
MISCNPFLALFAFCKVLEEKKLKILPNILHGPQTASQLGLKKLVLILHRRQYLLRLEKSSEVFSSNLQPSKPKTNPTTDFSYNGERGWIKEAQW